MARTKGVVGNRARIAMARTTVGKQFVGGGKRPRSVTGVDVPPWLNADIATMPLDECRAFARRLQCATRALVAYYNIAQEETAGDTVDEIINEMDADEFERAFGLKVAETESYPEVLARVANGGFAVEAAVEPAAEGLSSVASSRPMEQDTRGRDNYDEE